jgi:hypothetical protein
MRAVYPGNGKVWAGKDGSATCDWDDVGEGLEGSRRFGGLFAMTGQLPLYRSRRFLKLLSVDLALLAVREV